MLGMRRSQIVAAIDIRRPCTVHAKRDEAHGDAENNCPGDQERGRRQPRRRICDRIQRSRTSTELVTSGELA